MKIGMPKRNASLRRFRPVDALAWLMGAVDGLITTVVTPVSVRRQQAKGRFLQRWHFWVRRMLAESPAESLPDLPAESALSPLRQQLLGRTRGQIISLMGPPPATSAQPHPDARAPYWHADTWYYPPKAGRPAIAITFEQDIACSLDPLSGPR